MVLLIMGTRESATFNVIITVAHIALVVFIIIAGFVKARPENLQPFLLPDTGVKGTFQGAAVVFFSYIGFDAVATAAEEVSHCPQKQEHVLRYARMLDTTRCVGESEVFSIGFWHRG